MSAEEFGLVETAPPPSAPVQWHRHQQIKGGLSASLLLPKRSEQRCHALITMILPLVNEVREILTIQPRRDNTMKWKRGQQATAAQSSRA